MFILKTNLRTQYKKNATRLLRKKNRCPAIIYGKKKPNISIEFNQNHIQHPNSSKTININNIISLLINNKQSITVKIQDIQYHPFKPKITHIDFIQI